MKFEKKLIILSGDSFAKGTLALERNAYGTFATLSVYNLPDLNEGEYVLGIKNAGQAFTRKLGSLGRVAVRFKIEEMPLEQTHCVIFDTEEQTPLLYGASAQNKLWQGNMMDGLRSGKKTLSDKETAYSSDTYSQSDNKAKDFFLDIFPLGGEKYLDNAVAAVNYYPSDMSIEVSYTGRSSVPPVINPIDEAVKNKLSEGAKSAAAPQISKMADSFKKGAAAAQPQSVSADIHNADILSSETENPAQEPRHSVEPWEYQKSFVNGDFAYGRHFDENTQSPAFEEAAEGAFLDDEEPAETVQSKPKRDEKRKERFEFFDEPEPDIYIVDTAFKTKVNDYEKIKAQTNSQNIGNTAGAAKLVAPSAEGRKGESSPRVLNSYKINGASGAENTPGNSGGGGKDPSAAQAIPPPSEFTAEKAVNGFTAQAIFYEQIRAQLDDLFATNPRFELLEKMMPETKWIKVDYDNNGKYYVVGLVGIKPDYICYGVPAKYSPEPPQDLSGYCQWLPLDPAKSESEGFWLMFQDAQTGDSVKDI